MQLTKFSNLKIIHTPGKNLTVADMFSRTFTSSTSITTQTITTPNSLDFSILKDNQLKPVHYVVKHKEITYYQINDCHQFSLTMKTINSPYV